MTGLGEVARWKVDGSTLVLTNADGKELLRFSPASPARSWSVTGIAQAGSMQSVIPGVPLTAIIKEDGSIEGSAGCNDYTADATVDRAKGTISITKPDAGDKACSNADMTAQEDAYLAALPTVARYVLAGRDLTLISADGTPVVTLTRVS